MPWETPTLSDVRSLVRDKIHGSLPGSDATIANSVLRVMGDAQAALCFLTLEYVDWLSLQLLPDTAETTWLDRHGNIWLVNADGTTGRKQATLAAGTVAVTGLQGSIVPSGTTFSGGLTYGPSAYQTTAQAVVGSGPTQVPAQALDPGADSNLEPGAALAFLTPPPGLDATATVVTMDGGNDPETDDELRARILSRIRNPPMGGDQHDYVQWALAVPGCTRAWCAPQEMGIGTVTVRVMFDDLRADNGGFPLQQDLDAVTAYIDQMRPVTVKDRWVLSPIPQRCDVHIFNLNPDSDSIRAGIEQSLINMFFVNAAPGQTIYAAWKSYAIMTAPGVVSFDMTNTADDVMASAGNMGVLGDIFYDQ